uniref:Ig-like domain-containing protein n=1 Tax=Macrostomum lignano TaxID=282301 RepID=A0A1I8FPL9_9PLAT
LSGLSPFAGNDDYETLGNVKKCDWDFDRDAFASVSDEARDFIKSLLVRRPEKRLTVHEALDHPWLQRGREAAYDKLRQKMQDLHPNWFGGNLGIARLADFSSLRKLRMKEFQMHETSFGRAPFRASLKERLLPGGQNAVFECKVLSISPPIVTWARNDEALMQSVKYMQRYAGHDFSLKINRVKPEDGGTTRTTWSRPRGRQDPRKSPSPLPELWKEPDRPAKVTFPLRNRFIQEGGFVKLSCTFDGLPPPEVFWTKDGRELQPRGKDYNLQSRQVGWLSGSARPLQRVDERRPAQRDLLAIAAQRPQVAVPPPSSRKYSLEFESTSTSSTSRTEMRLIDQRHLREPRVGAELPAETDGDIHVISQGGRPGRAELAPSTPLPMTSASAWDLDGKPAQAEEALSRSARRGTSSSLLLPDALVEDSGCNTCTCSATPKAQAAQVKIDAHPRRCRSKMASRSSWRLKASGGTAVRWTANGKPVSADFEQYPEPNCSPLTQPSPPWPSASVRVAPPPDEPDAPSECWRLSRTTWTKENGTATGQLSNDGDRLRLVSADCDHSLNIAAAAATDSGLYRIDLTGPDGAKETACFSLQILPC